MSASETAGPAQDPQVRLRLPRGVGTAYTGLGVVLLVLAVVIPVSYLGTGRYVSALLSLALLGLLGVAFCRLGLPMLRTALTADEVGVHGRTPQGRRVRYIWPEVSIDFVEETVMLQLGPETLRLSDGGWSGFADFVALVCRSPQAAARLTPAARAELVRLISPRTTPGPDQEPPQRGPLPRRSGPG